MRRARLDGVFWLPALDQEGDLQQMTLAGWREALDLRVKALYRTMRPLYDRIATPGTFLITATRLGGRHGYDEAGALDPLGGGVTGFAKAYKRERPEALVKAVDFGAGAAAAEIADLLIDGGAARSRRGGNRIRGRPPLDGRAGRAGRIRRNPA